LEQLYTPAEYKVFTKKKLISSTGAFYEELCEVKNYLEDVFTGFHKIYYLAIWVQSEQVLFLTLAISIRVKETVSSRLRRDKKICFDKT
jgi:hypothetical protein